jgi:hypothetical protein
VSRAQFETNLAAKLSDDAFLQDIRVLIPSEVEYDPRTAAETVRRELVARLPGDPWRGED